MQRYFRRKDYSNSDGNLSRRIGKLELGFMGVGAVIGAGIFVITGKAAATMAGPAIIVSFLVAAFAVSVTALVYSELSSAYPSAGSAYSYTYATAGELFAWLVGWNLLLEYGLCESAVATGWSGYFRRFIEENLHIYLPKALTGPFDPANGTYMDISAFSILLLVFALLYAGIKESSRVNFGIVILKLLVLALFVIVGVQYVDFNNLTDFMPFGYEGVWMAASLLIFAYLGFDAVSTLAEESKEPTKTVPFALIFSFVVSMVLYMAVAFVLTSAVSYKQLDVPDALAFAMFRLGQPEVATIIALGAVVTMTSVLLVMGAGMTRVIYALSRDGLIFKSFSKVHPKYKTPHIATIYSGIITSAIAAVVPLKTLAELVNMGTLFAYFMSAIAVLILRSGKVQADRKFIIPAGKFLVPLNLFLIMFMMAGLAFQTWVRFLIWSVVGLLIYVYYGEKNSHLAK